MEVKKDVLEGNKVKLEIEIESDRVDEALEQAYRQVVKDVEIPGFRKGKAPRKIIEQRFGEEVLHKDALDILIPQGYSEAVEEADIEPIAQPDIEDFYISKGEAATFTAIVEVKPEVELGEYKGLGIEKEDTEVKEEEISQRLEKMQDEHSQLMTAEREELQEGDFAIIDFTGYVDGEEFPGGSAEEYSLEIGSGSFIPGFEEQLIGMKVGEEKTVEITFPEDYNAEDLAGADASFDVVLKEIKVKQRPELDDDFAVEASDYETMDELRVSIEEEIAEQKETSAENNFREKLIKKASKNAEVNITDTLIDEQLDQMFERLSQSISQQGLDMETYLGYIGMDEESWREDNRETASDRAKELLVLEAIADIEEIEVSDEEIDEEVNEIAEMHDQEPEQIKAILQMQGQLAQLKEDIRRQKTIEFLIENN
ncbi:trigger factor [Halanaerobium congolense]|jgi:trigger factor|uniref:Trigger factor n=1 Tax=Halanaerobium congolense TaxID=54121 RepID=A0A1G8PK66_9FIRM|nr:trigger factor [Halanaerobium congolense]KXS48896.1 MAG: trigger factor [Halanaerobium sp. T82-1]PUU92985.1 MAG: trigger factor [Halanaerobium sp.]SDI92605.1 trigger factor [Halanaerobium congolense]SET60823.1 trigger factor [Halanaerobium congolense]